jgi:CSLREA domain-containing protein
LAARYRLDFGATFYLNRPVSAGNRVSSLTEASASAQNGAVAFTTTQWSVVLNAQSELLRNAFATVLFCAVALALLAGIGVDITQQAAFPEIFIVNSTGDGDDAFHGDGQCETAVGNGVCTLRAAIEEANAHAGGRWLNQQHRCSTGAVEGRHEAAVAHILAMTDRCSCTLTTDQRGFARTVDNTSITNASGGDGTDIGAFELQTP